MLKLWDVASREERATLPCASAALCVALDGRRPLAACGDGAGNVYLAEFAGIEYGPIVVTAVDRNGGPTVRCAACLEYAPLEEGWLGEVVACPRDGCEGRMHINPFVVQRTRPN
jgi:hypothetical protein